MNQYVAEICKIGQGISCCRFLVVGPKGFECVKFTEHRHLLDFRAATGTMTAQSDNCDGYSIEESLQLLNEPKKAD